ncbi:DUF5615 family PIN-like protein [Plantactinospora sp. KBS50]|uniref:DUF5615 family PIN-like protein n=1 Tax=Plantactinospora sp. KBS50 TaxID=2024580 RepID=UPI000BAAE152|nr:DUF5615 family PIN-like protein [Plantactinospora sp. KBS50]ASW56032.1 hypothetical protein CIK06_20405 [Plantactinospora sp. KBS50]
MRVLLDEDVPEQVLQVLRHVLRRHTVDHIHSIKWSGKKDSQVLHDAVGRYDVLVTNNYRQFDDPDETSKIKKSGIHHVSYRQRQSGLTGLALAIGAIVASMPQIMADLEVAGGQRLVAIRGIDPTKRFTITDPRRDPPRYWPR